MVTEMQDLKCLSVPLYAHQQRGVAFLERRQGSAGVFAEMGTGKTRLVLTYLIPRAERILVVCPISALSGWRREISLYLEDAPKIEIVDLTSGVVRERASDLKRFASLGHPAVAITNYEAFWRDPLRSAILYWGPDAVVADEAHRLKHRSARQSKFAHFLAERPYVRYRIAMTGTPISNGLEDLHSLYRFITPDGSVFPRRWVDFEREYIVKGGYQGYQIVDYRNVEQARELISRTAFQVTKAECLDLPDRVDVVVPVELSKETRTTYDAMRKNAIAEICGVDEEGRPRDGTAVARITLTVVLRLQQITGGFCSTDTGIVDLGTEKLDVCTDLVEDILAQGQRVVIFCRFIRDLQRLKDRLKLPSSAILQGATPSRERERILEAMRDGKVKILLSQIQVGSLGVDMTAASAAIFYSTGFSLTDFLQARDRLHRIGQVNKVTYYHLLARKTVDEKVYRALAKKETLVRRATDLNYALDLLSV